ncbi:UNVERIFIED_CONTAM: hypothetical protein GTU68_024205 [Idotea baltica]|nr:hypothetical protein [Idotea baltica]
MSVSEAISQLSAQFGDRCITSDAVRDHHAQNEAHHAPVRPDAVLFPSSTGDVQKIAQICQAAKCPITAFGAGSSLEGQTIPLRGGISLDMSKMADVLAVHPEDLDAVVQPGVTRRRLNEELRATGLFFSVDPGADASIGGMAATRASGTNTVRYGTMRENVMALEVVLADGRVIRTGSRSRKSAAGYDLCKLMIGSEGTLGIITELTVRLFGQPEAISSAVCGFETLHGAIDAAIETIQTGMPVARIEFLDELQLRAVNAYSKLGLAEQPTLFLEFHGTEASVAEQAERFGEIAAEHGGLGFNWATLEEDRNRIWRARHDAFYGVKAMWPGRRGYITDACVPISKLAEAITETKAEIEKSGLIAPIVGHVGDGNFHLAIMMNPDDATERAAAADLADSIAERAIRLGGTVTGEHGVGMGKIKHMEAEHGDAYGVMGEIKRALDPHNILNPGKIVSLN